MASKDLYSYALKENGVWRCKVRLPWRTDDYIRVNGNPVNYKTHAQAAQAGSDAICQALCDKTTGFLTTPFKQNNEAKEVFKNFRGL